MSKWPKDQHFIPQAYLRLFSHDQKNIWVCDSVTATIQSQKIKDTGFIKWFYRSRLHPAPLESSVVSSIEGLAKTIIKKIEKKENLTEPELGQLLNFIILQFLRTPGARKRIKLGLDLFWQELRKIYRETDPKNKKARERAIYLAQSFITDQKIPNVSPEDFLEKDIEIIFPEELFPKSIHLFGYPLAEEIISQGWEFLFAENDDEFLTTDDPFSIIPSNEKEKMITITKEKTKIIPLSKKVCLVIGGDQKNMVRKVMLPGAIKVINLGIASLADRYVYSSNQDLLRDIMQDVPKFKKDPDSFISLLNKAATTHMSK